MSSVMALELASDDITINTIGLSWSEFGGMVDNMSQNALNEMTSQLIKPSSVSVEQLAHAIDFFASPVASEVTNQVLYFGGVK